MSTNKTENLNLHRWVPADPVSLSEVNANFTALDAAVAKAQEVADAAAVLPYAVGTYTGTGAALSINLGFRPRALIISGAKSNTNLSSYADNVSYNAITCGNVLTDRVAFTDTGFTVTGGFSSYPALSYNGRTYDYIAFR
jgi:hypothetical protein